MAGRRAESAWFHPYRDGNKRIGFLAMMTLLGQNGYELDATDAEVVAEIEALAEGSVSEDALVDWTRHNSSKRIAGLV